MRCLRIFESKKCYRVIILQSAVCGLQSAVCSLQSAVYDLHSAVCSLRSAVCGLQSAVCGLQMSYTGAKLLYSTRPTKPQNRWWSLRALIFLNVKRWCFYCIATLLSSSKKMTIRFKPHFSCLSGNADSCLLNISVSKQN